MKKTQRLEARRNIKAQLSSFISIVVIAMLAVTVYLGIAYSSRAMDENVSHYYNLVNTQDLQVFSAALLTPEDAEAIRALDGVTDVEGSFETVAWVPAEEDVVNVTVFSLPERVSAPQITRGRVPRTDDECIIEAMLSKKLGLSMGDTIHLQNISGGLPPLMTKGDFTITGIFEHPDHVTDKIDITPYVIVTDGVFDQSLLEGNWSRLRIRLADMPENRFTSAYTRAVAPVEQQVKELSAERMPIRVQQVHETYSSRIDDGEEQLAEAKLKLDDAEQQLADGEKQLEDSRTQITEGEKELADARQKLRDGQAQIADGEKQLADGEKQVADGEKQFADAEQQIADGEAQLRDGEQKIADAEQQLADGEKEYADGEKKILDGEQQIADAEKQIADGEVQLRDGEQQIADGEVQLRDGEQKLADGEKEYADGEKKILDGEQQFADAEKQIADGEAQLRDGEKKIADAEQQLADGEKQYADGEAQYAEGEKKIADGEQQLADAEKKLAEAKSHEDEYQAQYNKGLQDLADAERRLNLAPGQLADAELKLINARRQLDEVRNEMDSIYYDVKDLHLPKPSPEMVEDLKQEIRNHYGSRYDSYLNEIPDNFFDLPEDQQLWIIHEVVGYNAKEAEWERGRIDYYYSGEEYLDGLTAYENGKKKLEAATNAMQQLEDAETQIEEKKAELEEGKQQLIESRQKLDESRQQLEDGRKELEDGKKELEEKRQELEDGKKQLEEKRQELEDGKKQLAESRQKLEDGRKELEEKRQELEDGKKQLEEKRQELEDGKKQLEEKRQELEDGKKQLLESRQKLDDSRQQLEDGKKELEEKRQELEDGKTQLEEKRQELEDGKTQLEESRQQLEDARQQLSEGYREYKENQKKLEDGKKQLADGEKEFAEKKQEYEDGLKQYRENRSRLDQLESQIDDIDSLNWMVLTNRSNGGFIYAEANSKNLSSLSSSFSLMFVAIAALVIYASVSRMVDEQSTLVGTTKALGFYNKEVQYKYLMFGLLSTMTGVVAGILIAYFVLQSLVLKMYAPYYTMPQAPRCFLVGPTVMLFIGGILVAFLAVIFASYKLIKVPAVELMKGKTPDVNRAARTKNSGNLYTRLITLNMLSDPTRVIVTIVSIAGCCILLMVGFTLKFGQDRVVSRQYGEVLTFDAELRYDPDSPTVEDELIQLFGRKNIDYLRVSQESRAFSDGDDLSACTLICADPDDLPGWYNLRDARTMETLAEAESGVLITKRMHETYAVSEGDTITFYSTSMTPYKASVAGVFNNYFGQLTFVSPDAYREIFETDPVHNCFYLKLNGNDFKSLRRACRLYDGFLSLSDAASRREQIENTAKAMNVLIIVMIAMAGMMSWFILDNLSGSYMIRKKKELTIMRVNGFTTKECIWYAATELIITTILGILIGVPLGAAFGYRVIRLVEQSYMQMDRTLDIRSIIFSVLITAVFSMIINGRALSQIRSLKLSDAAN